jgi:hypothetical protein
MRRPIGRRQVHDRPGGRPAARPSAQATVYAPPLIAPWSITGASTLPERLRSQVKTSPAAVVPATLPATAVAAAAPDGSSRSVGLASASPEAGRMCQSPNSPDAVRSARTAQLGSAAKRWRNMAGSTPRNATSSASTVPNGISTNTRQSTSSGTTFSARSSRNAARDLGTATPAA